MVEGGQERWDKLLGGKSSEQLMDILLDDINHLRNRLGPTGASRL